VPAGREIAANGIAIHDNRPIAGDSGDAEEVESVGRREIVIGPFRLEGGVELADRAG
jgi:hypothetical protein